MDLRNSRKAAGHLTEICFIGTNGQHLLVQMHTQMGEEGLKGMGGGVKRRGAKEKQCGCPKAIRRYL
jgi:hypothetical protein